MLIYDNLKANREHRRLPIGAATAAVIEAQQQRVRARYPTEPASTLKSLPAMTRNPHGRKPITAHWVRIATASGSSALPEVHIVTSVEIDGTGGDDAALRQDADLPLRLPAHLRPTPRRRRAYPSTFCAS